MGVLTEILDIFPWDTSSRVYGTLKNAILCDFNKYATVLLLNFSHHTFNVPFQSSTTEHERDRTMSWYILKVLKKNSKNTSPH
jgi:hypothetical protein